MLQSAPKKQQLRSFASPRGPDAGEAGAEGTNGATTEALVAAPSHPIPTLKVKKPLQLSRYIY